MLLITLCLALFVTLCTAAPLHFHHHDRRQCPCDGGASILPMPSPSNCPPGMIPAPGLPSQGLPSQGLPIPGFPTPGFPTPGFPTPGFPTPGFPTPGFPMPGLPTAPPACIPVQQLPGFPGDSGALSPPSWPSFYPSRKKVKILKVLREKTHSLPIVIDTVVSGAPSGYLQSSSLPIDSGLATTLPAAPSLPPLPPLGPAPGIPGAGLGPGLGAPSILPVGLGGFPGVPGLGAPTLRQ